MTNYDNLDKLIEELEETVNQLDNIKDKQKAINKQLDASSKLVDEVKNHKKQIDDLHAEFLEEMEEEFKKKSNDVVELEKRIEVLESEIGDIKSDINASKSNVDELKNKVSIIMWVLGIALVFVFFKFVVKW